MSKAPRFGAGNGSMRVSASLLRGSLGRPL